MSAGKESETLEAMIRGEIAMDLAAMRRLAGRLAEGRPLSDLRELVEAIELVDLALLHGMPQSSVANLRDEAEKRLHFLHSMIGSN